MWSPIREALVNLWSAKLRSFLAILGVLVGTGSVVALISSSELATEHALAQFKKLGTNLVSLYIRYDANDPGAEKTPQFDDHDVPAVLHASPQINLVAPYTISFQSTYFRDVNLNAELLGVTGAFAKIAKISLLQGRFVSYLDNHALFCVVGAKIAEKIKQDGQSVLLNQVRIGNEMFTIVGVLKRWPNNLFISADINNSIMIPLNTAYLLDKNTRISNVLIRLNHDANVNAAKSAIATVMAQLLPHQPIVFNSPEQLITLIASSRKTYSLLLIAIASISLIVSGIGVMNIMLVSVIERRKEIGVRIAIGARQSDILRLFLIEAIILTVLGGLCGVVIGVLSSFMLTLFTHWDFHFYCMPIVLGFIVSAIVGVLSGFYPAWKASLLNPIETLMGE